jgi:hypothetical protein
VLDVNTGLRKSTLSYLTKTLDSLTHQGKLLFPSIRGYPQVRHTYFWNLEMERGIKLAKTVFPEVRSTKLSRVEVRLATQGMTLLSF